ncbi:hypothetical protein KEM55_004656 [Ascosphaera atra]|nr:hypothetical protein KEM55_004656 [Ascosphaera atra]
MVPYELGEKSSQLLKEMGMDVTFKTYKDMGHSADPTEIEDLEAFLKRVLPPAEGTA